MDNYVHSIPQVYDNFVLFRGYKITISSYKRKHNTCRTYLSHTLYLFILKTLYYYECLFLRRLRICLVRRKIARPIFLSRSSTIVSTKELFFLSYINSYCIIVAHLYRYLNHYRHLLSFLQVKQKTKKE